MPKRINKRTKAAAIRALERGELVRQVSKQFGISIGRLYQWCAVLEIKTLRSRRKIHYSEAVARIASGESPMAVAKEYGCALATLYIYCQSAGVQWPGHDRCSVSSYIILAALCKLGKNMAEIASEIGVSRQFVHQVRDRAEKVGIPLAIDKLSRPELVKRLVVMQETAATQTESEQV